MSAICGLYNRNLQPATAKDLARMAATIAYRGSAGGGSLLDGSAALAALLSATPNEARQELPLADQANGLAITADARLDNRGELFAALDLPGQERDWSDAALILAGYRNWREGVAARLLGDFAFAIWDAARKRLYCARDHFGVKQFYYHATPRRFAFATEVKALLVLPDVPQRVNEQRLGELILQLYNNQQQTLYQDIFRLTPASWISVTTSGMTSSVYWQLDPQREIRLRRDADYAEQFRVLLTDAVRVRLPASGPVGSDLSGGIDSSAITVLARDLLAEAGREPLHTFTADYSDMPQADERRYAEAVIKQGNVQPHFVQPTTRGSLAIWEREAWPDEPILSPTAVLSRMVYEAAQAQGVTVLLQGLGGDGVIGHGWEYLNELAYTGRWLKLAREARLLPGRYGSSTRNIISSRILLVAPGWARGWRRRLRGQPVAPRTAPHWRARLSEDFLARSGCQEHWADLQRRQTTPYRTHRQAQCDEFAGGAYSALSFNFTDRSAARFGLDLRFPFFDRRLVEFCLALPPDQKLRQGWTRWIARQALSGILPPEVATRSSKANFTPTANRGLIGADRELLEDILLTNPGAIAEYVAMDDVHSRYSSLLQDPVHEEGRPLWMIAELGLWLRGQTASE